tara:strand:+ start:156 stop:545 length:390 start_codon:yes stop_codon:yes gene_type:complete
MILLYENDLFNFKYKLPYLYITIKKGKIIKDEWIMSQLILKKFYEKNKKDKFYLVFEYKYLEICDMKKINNIQKLFNSFTNLNKIQVISCYIIINKNLHSIIKMLPFMKNRDVPTYFLENIDQLRINVI